MRIITPYMILGTWRANGKRSVARLQSQTVKLWLEVGCTGMQYGNPQFSLNLSLQLRIFRGNLRREGLHARVMTAWQTSLSNFLDISNI
jgi:hypothetical protein